MNILEGRQKPPAGQADTGEESALVPAFGKGRKRESGQGAPEWVPPVLIPGLLEKAENASGLWAEQGENGTQHGPEQGGENPTQIHG